MRLPKISLGPFAIDHAKIAIDEGQRGTVRVQIVLSVRDLTTGEPGQTVMSVQEHDRRLLEKRNGPALLRDLVRKQIIDGLAHEVDEWLLADGVRVREPHKEGSPMPNHNPPRPRYDTNGWRPGAWGGSLTLTMSAKDIP